MEKVHEKPNEVDEKFPHNAHIIKFNGNELRMGNYNGLPYLTKEEAKCIEKILQVLVDEGLTYGRMINILQSCEEIVKFSSLWEEMKEAPTFE